jgi:hypothetical protein
LNPTANNVTIEERMKATFHNPYPVVSSGVDSLDDFGTVTKKGGTIASLDDDFDLGPTKSVSRMDRIDDIHLVSPKKKTRNKSFKYLDRIDSSSSTDSETDSSSDDDESLNSDLSSTRSGKASSNIKSHTENGRISDVKQNLDISSRSSSKSDLSEKSGSDLSYELMTKAYRNSPVAATFMKDKGYLLSGSPTVSENGRTGEKTAQGLVAPQPLKIPSQFSQRPPITTLQSEASIAAEREIDRVDREMVKEIADDVMERLFSGKIVSPAERQEAYNRVTEDIWKDFRKPPNPLSSSVWSMENKPLYTQMSLGSLDNRQKKSYAEQFMKNHYQQNLTDPLQQKSGFSPSPSPSTFPYPSKPPLPSRDNFPTLNMTEGVPSPLSLPTSLSSVNSYPSSNTLPSATRSIWSTDASVGEGKSSVSSVSSFSTPPPPLNLPSFASGPFGSISIGTSLSGSSVSSSLPAIFGSHADQGTQAGVETRDCEVNTDVYEPYRAEYVRSQEECELLKTTLTRVQAQVQQEREVMLRECTTKTQVRRLRNVSGVSEQWQDLG